MPKEKSRRKRVRVGGNKKARTDGEAEDTMQRALNIVTQQHWAPIATRKNVSEARDASQAAFARDNEDYTKRLDQVLDLQEIAGFMPRVNKELYEAFHGRPFVPDKDWIDKQKRRKAALDVVSRNYWEPISKKENVLASNAAFNEIANQMPSYYHLYDASPLYPEYKRRAMDVTARTDAAYNIPLIDRHMYQTFRGHPVEMAKR